MSSVALTINVNEANAPSPLPAALAARLNGTPTKSPEDLAKEIEVHTERTKKLREAHLESVRDRAAREVQRAQEAVARKLRLASARADKVQRKIDAATTKTEAKKEADEAEREARKERRAELALAVAESRRAAVEARALRQAELLAAEKNASVKHAKVVNEVIAKGKCAVQHAIAVAQAHKEKEALSAVNRGEALASRLHAAETRRQLAAPDAPHTPPRQLPLYRVRNDERVNAEMRRLAHESSMAKANEKRSAHLAIVQGKAHAENAKAADVVATMKAAATGTDAATTEARSAMYERLLGAEVARQSVLKAKISKNGVRMQVDGAIIVRTDDVLTPRAPPAELIKRLSVVGSSLLSTAASRQEGAACRRKMIKHARQLLLANAAARRAATLARLGKYRAALAAELDAKKVRVSINRAMIEGKRAHVIEMEHTRAAKAGVKRSHTSEGLRLAGEAKAAKYAAAAESRAEVLRKVAKAGGMATRAAAFQSKREAMENARVARSAAYSLRCTNAAAKREEILAKRVKVAQQRSTSAS